MRKLQVTSDMLQDLLTLRTLGVMQVVSQSQHNEDATFSFTHPRLAESIADNAELKAVLANVEPNEHVYMIAPVRDVELPRLVVTQERLADFLELTTDDLAVVRRFGDDSALLTFNNPHELAKRMQDKALALILANSTDAHLCTVHMLPPQPEPEVLH